MREGRFLSRRRPSNPVTIHIDDEELSLAEFGRLLSVHAGWGMRIAFVPEEFVDENPTVKVRERKRLNPRSGVGAISSDPRVHPEDFAGGDPAGVRDSVLVASSARARAEIGHQALALRRNSFQPTPPFTTLSTSNAISYQLNRTACSAPRR
jgi:hypothetical protein